MILVKNSNLTIRSRKLLKRKIKINVLQIIVCLLAAVAF